MYAGGDICSAPWWKFLSQSWTEPLTKLICTGDRALLHGIFIFLFLFCLFVGCEKSI